MKKTNRFLKTLVFVLFIVFLCMSCENLFSPVVKDKTSEAAASPTENTGSGKKGIVKIAINKDAARTIYPDAPQFEKYRLEFEEAGGQTPQNPLEFPPSEISTAVLYLAPGIWTITAYGQVTLNGELTDVATGSVTVTVTEEEMVTAPITLYSGTSGGDGSFSWSIAAPLGVEADTWSINLTKYNSVEDPELEEGGPFDFSSDALSQSGEIPCSPGYYLLKVEVGNTKQRATRTEIVLIHPGLQSRAQFSFSEKDFIKLIRVSGTLSLSTSEGPVSGFKYLDLQLLREKSSELLSGTSVNPDGTWEMLLPVQTESRTLSFSVNAETTDGHYFNTYLNSSVEIKDVDVEKTIDENLLILSGSTSGMDEDIDDIFVHVSDESVAGYYRNASTRADESGNWKMYLPTSTITFTPRFGVQISSTNNVNRFFEKTLDYSIGTEDISGISIDTNQITVSGTLEVLKNSLPVNITSGSINMYKVGQNNSFGSAPIDESGNWIMSVEPLVDPVPVYFTFSGYDINDNYFSGTSKGDWLVQASSVTGIEIVKEYITVSGTLSAGTSGADFSQEQYMVFVIQESEYMKGLIGGGTGSSTSVLPDGTWSLNVTLEDTGLWNIFIVNYGSDIAYSGTKEAFRLAENLEITSAGVSGINAVLSDLPLITKTISGSVIGIPEGTELIMYCGSKDMFTTYLVYGMYHSDLTSWSMGVPSADTEYEAYFFVMTVDSDTSSEMNYYMTSEPILIGTSDMEGIALSFADMVPVYPY